MAILDVTEYQFLAQDLNQVRHGVAGSEPNLAQQQITALSGTSQQSAAFQDSTRFVRVHSDVVCRIQFGTNPTAAGTSFRLAAGVTEYFGVRGNTTGGSLKVAAITST